MECLIEENYQYTLSALRQPSGPPTSFQKVSFLFYFGLWLQSSLIAGIPILRSWVQIMPLAPCIFIIGLP